MATKRKDGRWQTNVYIGDHYKTLTAKTQKELKEKERKLRKELAEGIDVVKQTDTLSVWADRVKQVKKLKLNAYEFRNFSTRLEVFLEEIGYMKLINVNIANIQPIIDTLAVENPTTHKPTAKKTLRAYNLALSQVFEYAIKNRVTQFNPCKYIEIPEDAPKQIRRNLTKEEQQYILNTDHFLKTGCMIMLFAGLRRGEVSALQWSDIDLQERTITINKSYNNVTNEIKSPKTQAGFRTVRMPDILVDYLKQVPKNSIYVMTSKNGKLMTDKTWVYNWNDYLETIRKCHGKPVYNKQGEIVDRLPIERFTPHMLRHTYCTYLKDSDVNIKDAQGLMGHSDSQTTLNVYTHTDNDSQIRAVNQLNEMLNKRFG